MQIIPKTIIPVRKTKTLPSLAPLQDSVLPPNTYALGLAQDGLPVIANICQSPPILAASDDTASLQALLETIAATARFPAKQTSIGAVIVSRTPGRWQGIHPKTAAISPKRLGDILQYHIETHPPHRLPILLDNLGAGWNIEYRALALLANAPQFHLVVTTSPQHACRFRSLFDKILVGEIHDFSTLFDLTAPTTLTSSPTNGQFAFRRQSRWLTFTPVTP
jgi:hypothetical protein